MTSITEHCKTPRGQMVIFGVILAEMALGIYTFVFAAPPSTYDYGANSTIYYRSYHYNTYFDLGYGGDQYIGILAMIDIPILGIAFLGLRKLCSMRVDGGVMLLRAFLIMCVSAFILYVVLAEIQSISPSVGLGKLVYSIGLVAAFSAIGSLVLFLKGLFEEPDSL